MSETAGALCEAADCPRHGQPMAPCNCADGMHNEASARAGTEAEEGGDNNEEEKL